MESVNEEINLNEESVNSLLLYLNSSLERLVNGEDLQSPKFQRNMPLFQDSATNLLMHTNRILEQLRTKVIANGSQFGQFLKWTNQGWVASNLPTTTSGNKVLLNTTDPTVDTVANIADVFLNTSSGTLYEKSSMTQSDFITSGLQGLMLANAVWLNKGNLKGTAGENATIGNFLRPAGAYTIDKNDTVLISIVNGPNVGATTVNNLTLPKITNTDKFLCSIVVCNPTGCNLILPTGTFPMVQPWGATVNVGYKFVDANGIYTTETSKFLALGSKVKVCGIFDFSGNIIFYLY